MGTQRRSPRMPMDFRDQLEQAVIRRRLLDEAITSMVESARVTGVPWSDIAAVLGVTKQAAAQRYGRSS